MWFRKKGSKCVTFVTANSIGNKPNDLSVALEDILYHVFVFFRKDLHIRQACCQGRSVWKKMQGWVWRGRECLWYRTLVQRCFLRKLFLKISQDSQENTCVGVTF